jgi:hypothetical protein
VEGKKYESFWIRAPFNLNYSLKALSPDTVTQGGDGGKGSTAFTYEFGRTQFCH